MRQLSAFVTLLLVTLAPSSGGTNLSPTEVPEQLDLTFDDLQALRAALTPQTLLSLTAESDERSLACSADLLRYLASLVTLKPWALQMFDATAKIPESIFYANHEFLGQYDECIAVSHPNITFHGQHCLLEGNLKLSFPGIPAGQKSTFWYGICVPSSCHAHDLNQGISRIGNITRGLVTLSADENNCYTKDSPKPGTGDWVVVGFLAFLGLLGVVSTLYDLKKQSDGSGKAHPLLISFSLYSNGKSLFGVSSGGDQMQCLNGIRVISMVWVVYFHVFTTQVAGPILNTTQAFAARTETIYAVLGNAYLAVDSFLLISGLLLALSFFRTIVRTGTYDAPLGYVHRYFRLTPSYAMVLLFQVTVYRYIGDGPMWYFIQNTQSSVCYDYWWSGLIYVQNYVNPDSLCLIQTWYLSADMQFYWISPLVLYPMWKWRKFAPAYITVLVLIFTFLPFSVAYIYGLAPVATIDTTGDQNRLDNYPSHSRATPWLVGVALAYLIIELRDRKIKFSNLSKMWVLAGWLVAGLIAGLSLFGHIAFQNDESYHPGDTSFAAAFYLAFHRLGWALGLAWLILACINGHGGPINTFLSWGFFHPMGKLSYGVYLSHVSVLIYRLGTLRTNIYFNMSETLFFFLSIYVVSHFVSMLLYLFVEAPFFIIDRHLLRKAKVLPLPRPQKKNAVDLPTNK